MNVSGSQTRSQTSETCNLEQNATPNPSPTSIQAPTASKLHNLKPCPPISSPVSFVPRPWEPPLCSDVAYGLLPGGSYGEGRPHRLGPLPPPWGLGPSAGPGGGMGCPMGTGLGSISSMGMCTDRDKGIRARMSSRCGPNRNDMS